MTDSLNQMINKVSAFCGEHTEILLTLCAVVIALIVIIAVIAGIRSRNRGKYKTDMAAPAAGIENEKTAAEPQPEKPDEPEQKIAACDDINTSAVSSKEDDIPVTHAGAHKADVAETKIYHGKIQNILEELSGMAAGGLEEIEVKIQGAEVRIRYSSRELAAKGAGANGMNSSGQSGVIGAPGEGSTDGEKIDKIIEEKITPDDISEEISHIAGENSGKGHTAGAENQAGSETKFRKFGPDNINRTRSGKIFTEQELSQKIRD